MKSLRHSLEARNPGDVVLLDGESRITAGQLLSEIDRLRVRLNGAGIARLGLLAPNSAAWISLDLACLFGDICLLPLPGYFTDAQLAHAVATAGLDAVLTKDPMRVRRITGARDADAGDWPQGLSLVGCPAPAVPLLPKGTRKITFTSGSTGRPKGVCLSAGNQLSVAESLAQCVPLSAPRHLCLLPLSTLLENIGGVYYPLLAGGQVCIGSANGMSSGAPATESLLFDIERDRPASMILLPHMLAGLVRALENGWSAPTELQFVATGGTKVPAGLLRRARSAGLPVYEGYGLSEAGSVACLNYPGNDRIGSVGRPLPHVQIRLRENEVVMSGNTFLGYAGQPDSWNSPTLHTGDLGFMDDEGYLYLSGRRSNLLISDMGRNISPEWVESEILAYPEIAQCVVFGDGRPCCVALLAATDNAVSDAHLQGIVDTVNTRLPDYAQIRNWHRLKQTLTPQSGLYTPNGRPNRPRIEQHHATILDTLYGSTCHEIL